MCEKRSAAAVAHALHCFGIGGQGRQCFDERVRVAETDADSTSRLSYGIRCLTMIGTDENRGTSSRHHAIELAPIVPALVCEPHNHANNLTLSR